MCNSVPGPVLNSNGQSKYDFKTLGLVNYTCFSRLTSSVISNPGTIYSRNRQYLQRDLSYFPRHLAYVPLYEGRHAGRKMNEVLEPMAQVPKRTMQPSTDFQVSTLSLSALGETWEPSGWPNLQSAYIVPLEPTKGTTSSNTTRSRCKVC